MERFMDWEIGGSKIGNDLKVKKGTFEKTTLGFKCTRMLNLSKSTDYLGKFRFALTKNKRTKRPEKKCKK